MLGLVLLVNCEGHLFVADFVAVADTFVVDRYVADIDVGEWAGDSGAERSVGMQMLDMRWFWSKWLQEVLPLHLIDAQDALLDLRHDFHLSCDLAPPSLLPNHQTSSFLLFSVDSPSHPPFSEIPLTFDSDLQIPDFSCGFAGFALAAHLVSCSTMIQCYSWAAAPLSEVFL